MILSAIFSTHLIVCSFSFACTFGNTFVSVSALATKKETWSTTIITAGIAFQGFSSSPRVILPLDMLYAATPMLLVTHVSLGLKMPCTI